MNKKYFWSDNFNLNLDELNSVFQNLKDQNKIRILEIHSCPKGHVVWAYWNIYSSANFCCYCNCAVKEKDISISCTIEMTDTWQEKIMLRQLELFRV